MSNRLNQEREQRLQPERIKMAIESLTHLGLAPYCTSSTEVRFKYKGHEIKYFPYSGWHTGKTIKDGRGYKHLFGQL